MPIDAAKVTALSEEVNLLEAQLAEVRAKLVAAITEGGTPGTSVPRIPTDLSITEEIFAYAAVHATFRVRDIHEHMKEKGYKGNRNSINSRVHRLLADNRLKKVSPGVFKRP